MSDTEQDRTPGGVPHTFRLRLVWQWMRQMPPQLRRRKAFLYALQTIASMADAAGRTRFSDTGQPIRFSQLAAAMGSREKDARRYLSAAIAAGVLATEQAPRRGRSTVYVLLVPGSAPRWAAALAVLDAGETSRDEAEPSHARTDTEFGPASPEPAAPARTLGSGGDRPNPTPAYGARVRATDARPGSGDDRPLSSGYAPPNNPGVLKIHPQEMVAVGPQPEDARGHETHERADAAPSALHAVPAPAPAASRGRAPRIPAGQPPLLLPVPSPARPAERPAHAPAGDRPVGAPPGGWRAAVARERPDDAAAVYRDRWTGEHARLLPDDPTGT